MRDSVGEWGQIVVDMRVRISYSGHPPASSGKAPTGARGLSHHGTAARLQSGHRDHRNENFPPRRNLQGKAGPEPERIALAAELFATRHWYATPKVGVRVVVLENCHLLPVGEREDGCGWAEVG
jgi:hypothetical protein